MSRGQSVPFMVGAIKRSSLSVAARPTIKVTLDNFKCTKDVNKARRKLRALRPTIFGDLFGPKVANCDVYVAANASRQETDELHKLARDRGLSFAAGNKILAIHNWRNVGAIQNTIRINETNITNYETRPMIGRYSDLRLELEGRTTPFVAIGLPYQISSEMLTISLSDITDDYDLYKAPHNEIMTGLRMMLESWRRDIGRRLFNECCEMGVGSSAHFFNFDNIEQVRRRLIYDQLYHYYVDCAPNIHDFNRNLEISATHGPESMTRFIYELSQDTISWVE